MSLYPCTFVSLNLCILLFLYPSIFVSFYHITFELLNPKGCFKKTQEQPGTELGQAQLKLGLDFTLIFCRFGFTRYNFVELV